MSVRARAERLRKNRPRKKRHNQKSILFLKENGPPRKVGRFLWLSLPPALPSAAILCIMTDT